MADYFTRSNGGVLNTPMVDRLDDAVDVRRSRGRMDAVRTLLDSGADVNETASNGLSVLVLAIINAHYELASFLLDRGADPNAAGQGWTALHQVVDDAATELWSLPSPASNRPRVSDGAARRS